MVFSVVCLAGLLFCVGAQFTCNKIKIKEQCDGIIASDGVCVWQGIYCSAGAPAPSPTVVTVTAPELVCPATAGEASCIYDPCRVGEICYANTDAACVVNNCIGAVEYLGTFLTEPCSAVYVNLTSMEVQACNVREILRLPTETVEEDTATDTVPEETSSEESQTVSSSLLGLPQQTVDEEPQVPTLSVGLPPAQATPSNTNGLTDVLGLSTIGDEEEDNETDEDAPIMEPLN